MIMGKRIVLAVLAALLLAGCRTKYVAVPEVHMRDSVVLRLQRDSVFLRDSVFVNTWTRGDTVFVDKVKTTCLYKDRLRVDTVLVEKRDSNVYVVENVREKAVYRTRWYDKACRYVAAGLAIALAVVGAWARRK